MANLSLGLDVGTQGTKGIVIDATTHEVVGRASRSYDLIPDLPPGAAEQHPQTWADAVVGVVQDLAAEGVDLAQMASVGVSGQQHGLVTLDGENKVVRPAKLWCDTATAAEASALADKFGEAVPVGFTASKIAWIQQHEPGNWEATKLVMLPHDYINLLLTGQACMEVGDASGTGLFDVRGRQFDQRKLNLLGGGISDRLPKLIDAPELAGAISGVGAAWSGLPAGIPVSAGGGDNMMSAIGSGAILPGVSVVSLGTSATAFAYAAEPVIDPQGLIAPFCSSSGGWLPLLCTMNATAVVDEVRQTFGTDHAGLTQAAAAIAPGSDGLLLLPFLMGERVPDLPLATGTLVGMRHGWLEPARLYRAAIEGVSLGLAWGIGRLSELGVTLGEVRVVGGGAVNPLWRQILADLLNVPVQRMLESESAALGAALQARWSALVAKGERVSLSEVASPFVHSTDQTQPSQHVAAYQEVKSRYQAELERLYL